MTFTFFDLVAAIREIRQLKFTEAGSDVQDYATGLNNVSRDSRTWDVIISDGRVFRWSESNTGGVVISRV